MGNRLSLSIVFAAFACACMSQTDLASVNAAVDRFHQQQASGADEAIYQAAAPDLRAAASLDDLRRIDAAVRAVQGCAPPGHDPSSWNNNVNTTGHFITLVYSRQCASGSLTETFVFRINGPQALLVGYNASGMALFPPAPPASAPATTMSTDTTAMTSTTIKAPPR